MKAIEITEDHRLRLIERPVPTPKPGEILIKVHAAGVNRPDILQRLGKYPPPPGASDLPGLEVAGIRENTGEAVCALLAGGGYAEYAVAPEGQCLPIPKGLDMIHAAALPETFFTVWNNVFVRGQLKKGETVLIHGGASGIGTTAIQMAKAFGARVAVTAGTDDKSAACLKLGADLAINYKTQDFVEEIEKAWGKDTVHVVLDMVGGSYVPKDIRLLATDGRHVSIATMESAKTEIDIRQIMQKRIVLTGSTLRPRSAAEKTELARGLKEQVWPLIEAGKIKPSIFKTFSLKSAMEAHESLEKGDHFGKIVLTVT
jgi:NADPH2:quinone reductase